MAKEMMIVFVYDTAKCKEEDDLADAVMYFHPAWVSSAQRHALAGQLMGVNQFLTSSFGAPHAITLQGGKFILKKCGQYILAVGTDRNIHDWILERRANTLQTMLKFFHCSLENISTSFNNDRNKFTEKLYQIFETYLPILQYSVNLFSNMPIMKLPKSASNVFLESIHLLQYCQETNGIMGGALFYNNKVVATQLSPELTKQIVITDPYRIKAPADRVKTEFHLPLGVQLFQVYIEQKYFRKLLQEANAERCYSSYLEITAKKAAQRKVSKNPIKDPMISGMKRDTSRIFTVPEEGELDTLRYNDPLSYTSTQTTYNSPIKRKQENKIDRTKCSNPLTPSVCSTPLKDVNRVLHGTAVLICNTNDEKEDDKVEKDSNLITEEYPKTDDIPDIVKEALRCKRLNKLCNATSESKIVKSDHLSEKSLSVPDLGVPTHTHSNTISLRTYSLGLPKISGNVYEDSDLLACEDKDLKEKQRYYTITDPHYPVFRGDGLPVSQSLYEHYISTQYQKLEDETAKKNQTIDLLPSLSDVSSSKTAASSLNIISNDTLNSGRNSSCDVKANKFKQETYRRSMSLPLKPMNIMDSDDGRKSASECGSTAYDFMQKRKLGGLQLTPLMSKLSLLADDTSGFCSRETTPSEFRDFSGFSNSNSQIIKQKLEAADRERNSDEEDDLEEDWITNTKDEEILMKTELFLCGHQNMVLILLMENGTGNNPDLIHSLWKTCIKTLEKLENRLQQCLDPLPTNENKELYSILGVDPQWDTVHRSGLWGVSELDIVSTIHDRFVNESNLTDVIVRTEDTVVYGNQCGKLEVFYQQAVAPNTVGGLPTPADLMGTISLKAKRRLDRDHGIVLL